VPHPGFTGQPDFSGPCASSIDIDAEKSNSALLSKTVRAIRCGVAGDVVFHVLNDAAATFRTVTLAAGDKFDLFYIDQVKNTGTTATGLLGGV
jgi:hypothetical protein